MSQPSLNSDKHGNAEQSKHNFHYFEIQSSESTMFNLQKPKRTNAVHDAGVEFVFNTTSVYFTRF